MNSQLGWMGNQGPQGQLGGYGQTGPLNAGYQNPGPWAQSPPLPVGQNPGNGNGGNIDPFNPLSWLQGNFQGNKDVANWLNGVAHDDSLGQGAAKTVNGIAHGTYIDDGLNGGAKLQCIIIL